jgi:SAM-dependent methyltransferase
MKDAWLERWADLIAAQASAPRILELGCGEGLDTAWLAQHGYSDLIAVDLDSKSLAQCAQHVPAAMVLRHDLRHPLPFADGSIDVVVASLCLHYFEWDKTREIAAGIRRCLKENGLLLCRLNSTRDVHYGAVGHPEIGPHYYLVDGESKRFFDEDEVRALFSEGWEMLAREELTIDRYEMPKTVWETVLRKSSSRQSGLLVS